MRIAKVWVGLSVCVAAASACALASAAEKYRALFNGKDLTGWHIQEGKIDPWKATADGVACTAPGGGFLTLDGEYGDFEVRLDYKLPPGGNSGVGIRYPPGGHPSTTGIEVQLLDDDSPMYAKLHASQYNASLYKLVPPKERAAKPAGQWNHIEIRCQGPRIRVRLNGKTVQDVSCDDFATPPADDPALPPLAKRPRRGCIGLQSHGDPVEFRNVELREL